MNQDDDTSAAQANFRGRDAESFMILGGFLCFLAALVLLATFFEAAGHARYVNMGAGLALMAIGATMGAWGRHLRRIVKRD